MYFDRSSHEQVIAALAEERIEWQALTWAGWPQLPYEVLKTIPNLPPTPATELKKIPSAGLRKDALRVRAEMDAAREKELQAVEDE